jgi:hypothetical protein
VQVDELRRNLTAARKAHEEALDNIDSLTNGKTALLREAQVARAEKTKIEEELKATIAVLEQTKARFLRIWCSLRALSS